MRRRGGWYLFAVVVPLGLASASAASSVDGPPLIWSVSDDELSVPIGTIADVAVGGDGITYLLDTQNFLVLRIDGSGRELSPLGRRGEGPGEFMHPRLVSSTTRGECVVIQDFYSPAVCLEPNGDVCAGPDLSSIRDRFAIVQFFNARTDAVGRFLLTAMTTDRMPDSASDSERLRTAWSVFRLEVNSRAPTVLFSDHPERHEPATIVLSKHAASYTDRGWDISGKGRIVFADPAGRYRVTIGHPADGTSRQLDLMEKPTDEADLRRLAKSVGQDVGDIPRVASVYWVDEEHFLVKPSACLPGRTHSRGGTFELFDVAGRSGGRAHLDCDYDPDQDSFFLRFGTLVIIKGGKAATDAAIRQKAAMIGKPADAPPADDSESEVIRVHAYNLVAHYVRR